MTELRACVGRAAARREGGERAATMVGSDRLSVRSYTTFSPRHHCSGRQLTRVLLLRLPSADLTKPKAAAVRAGSGRRAFIRQSDRCCCADGHVTPATRKRGESFMQTRTQCAGSSSAATDGQECYSLFHGRSAGRRLRAGKQPPPPCKNNWLSTKSRVQTPLSMIDGLLVRRK